MSDITTTLTAAYREFCIQAHGATVGLRNRVTDQSGQTAAEYMGILLVVAVIIGDAGRVAARRQDRQGRGRDGRQDRRQVATLPKLRDLGPASAPRSLRPGSGALLRPAPGSYP